jgi:hypothetical protein
MLVVTHLAEVLGVSVPKLYLDPKTEGIDLLPNEKDVWTIGTTAHASPSTPRHRGDVGRALFTMAVGGAHIRGEIADSARVAYLVGLLRAANVEVPSVIHDACEGAKIPSFDDSTLGNIGSLEEAGREVVDSVINSREAFNAQSISIALDRAEDRVAILCAADPRPILREFLDSGTLASPRGQALLDFLFADEHLRLREAWGYRVVHDGLEGGTP